MTTIINTIAKKRNHFLQLAQNITAAFCGSIVIALAAPLSYTLPFSAIPFSIQPHVALLIAFLLGKKLGPLAVAMFITQGAMGAPVFANGACGLLNLLGPRGGYLAGYFMAAIFIGNYKPTTFIQTFLVFAASNAVIYLFGAIYLATFVGPLKALTVGIFPFLLTDALKLLIITKIATLKNVYSPLQ